MPIMIPTTTTDYNGFMVDLLILLLVLIS